MRATRNNATRAKLWKLCLSQGVQMDTGFALERGVGVEALGITGFTVL